MFYLFRCSHVFSAAVKCLILLRIDILSVQTNRVEQQQQSNYRLHFYTFLGRKNN